MAGIYINTNIAKVNEADLLSFGNQKNFITFEPISDTSTLVAYELEVLRAIDDESRTEIEFIFLDNVVRIKGTLDENEVDNTTFFINRTDTKILAENIRIVLMRNQYIANNFNVDIKLAVNGQNVSLTNKISITSKSSGKLYNHKVNFDSIFLAQHGKSDNSINNNTIDLGGGETDIELDIYTNTGLYLGQDDTPKATSKGLGLLAGTISKHYIKGSQSFDINSLIKQNLPYSSDFLHSIDWVNAGTIANYRFYAKIYDGKQRIPFFISRVNYVLNGYNRMLDDNSILQKYIYNSVFSFERIEPLTNNRKKKWSENQIEFFNFILNDPQRGIADFTIALKYTYYTQSGKLITTHYKHQRPKSFFTSVNTVRIQPEIELVELDSNLTVGAFTVELTRNEKIISNSIDFEIVPSCIVESEPIAFLSKLGGWECFNFTGSHSNKFTTKKETIFKNLKPNSSISDEVESVTHSDNAEQYTLSSGVITKDTAEWLKELANSKAVYEYRTKRYIIVEKADIEISSNQDSAHVQITYRYSDKYQ